MNWPQALTMNRTLNAEKKPWQRTCEGTANSLLPRQDRQGTSEMLFLIHFEIAQRLAITPSNGSRRPPNGSRPGSKLLLGHGTQLPSWKAGG